jgi:hypothetical protein
VEKKTNLTPEDIQKMSAEKLGELIKEASTELKVKGAVKPKSVCFICIPCGS